MTRFWLPIEWPVIYMLRTFPDASLDKAMIPPTLKAASVLEIADAVAGILNVPKYEIKNIPIRPGEKIHEAMMSQHSGDFFSSETCTRFTREELVNVLTPVVEKAMVSA